jgi:hypothetical protein
MTLTTSQQKVVLAALVAAIVVLTVYQQATQVPPRTQPLTYTHGMKVASPVRKGLSAPGAAADPLAIFLERQAEKYPGVLRDIFRMSDQTPKGKQKPVVEAPQAAVITQPVSTIPVKTPEEIAADIARADLSKFRFLGYLTDKDSSLFLSKEGELFIVKSGDMVLKNYQIKAVGKDHVVLYDTVTKVEVRIELSGSGGK